MQETREKMNRKDRPVRIFIALLILGIACPPPCAPPGCARRLRRSTATRWPARSRIVPPATSTWATHRRGSVS